MSSITDHDLEAYLDEALPASEMAELEQQLRGDRALLERLAALGARRDGGLHSLGAIWRRHRLTCPSRPQLGSYLLGIIPDAEARSLKFHIEIIGCRLCQANLADLSNQQSESAARANVRRQRYFQSSAGYLKR